LWDHSLHNFSRDSHGGAYRAAPEAMYEMTTQEGAKLYGYYLLFNPDDFYHSPAVMSGLSGCGAAFALTLVGTHKMSISCANMSSICIR
jgi:hypothetical protein